MGFWIVSEWLLKLALRAAALLHKAEYAMQEPFTFSRIKIVYLVITTKWIEYNWKSISYEGFFKEISRIRDGFFHSDFRIFRLLARSVIASALAFYQSLVRPSKRGQQINYFNLIIFKLLFQKHFQKHKLLHHSQHIHFQSLNSILLHLLQNLSRYSNQTMKQRKQLILMLVRYLGILLC